MSASLPALREDDPPPPALPDHVEQASQTLQQLADEAKTHAEEHRQQARRAARTHNLFGIPAAVFASFGGLAALASEDSTPQWFRLGAAVAAVIGGGLAGAATTLNAGRKAETASLQAASYEALRREVEQTRMLDLRRFDATEMRDAIDRYVRWMNDIEGLPARASAYERWSEQRNAALPPSSAGSP